MMKIKDWPVGSKERDMAARMFCDTTIAGSARIMQDEGATFEEILDRMMTYAVAQSFEAFGKDETVQLLCKVAFNIHNGALDSLKPSKVQ